jgi:hypothetical protein
MSLAALMAMHVAFVLLLFRRQELWLQFALLGTASVNTVGLQYLPRWPLSTLFKQSLAESHGNTPHPPHDRSAQVWDVFFRVSNVDVLVRFWGIAWKSVVLVVHAASSRGELRRRSQVLTVLEQALVFVRHLLPTVSVPNSCRRLIATCLPLFEEQVAYDRCCMH